MFACEGFDQATLTAVMIRVIKIKAGIPVFFMWLF